MSHDIYLVLDRCLCGCGSSGSGGGSRRGGRGGFNAQGIACGHASRHTDVDVDLLLLLGLKGKNWLLYRERLCSRKSCCRSIYKVKCSTWYWTGAGVGAGVVVVVVDVVVVVASTH